MSSAAPPLGAMFARPSARAQAAAAACRAVAAAAISRETWVGPQTRGKRASRRRMAAACGRL
eukprot:2801750-Prymnesium_polylepis.1